MKDTVDVRRWFVTVVLMTLVLVAGSGSVRAGHHTDAVASCDGLEGERFRLVAIAVGALG